MNLELIEQEQIFLQQIFNKNQIIINLQKQILEMSEKNGPKGQVSAEGSGI